MGTRIQKSARDDSKMDMMMVGINYYHENI